MTLAANRITIYRDRGLARAQPHLVASAPGPPFKPRARPPDLWRPHLARPSNHGHAPQTAANRQCGPARHRRSHAAPAANRITTSRDRGPGRGSNMTPAANRITTSRDPGLARAQPHLVASSSGPPFKPRALTPPRRSTHPVGFKPQAPTPNAPGGVQTTGSHALQTAANGQCSPARHRRSHAASAANRITTSRDRGPAGALT